MIHPQTRAILEALGQSVFVLDTERRILFANPAAEQSFGSGLEGRDFVAAVRHPECLRAIDEVLAGNSSTVRTEATVGTAPQTIYEVAVARLDGDGPGEAAVAVCLADISAIREAEQIRSDFVANVSHELRSPLTALAGLVETLQGPARDDPEARARFLGLMEAEASRMKRLISDLLSLSKVEARERVRPTRSVDIAALAQHAAETLEKQAQEERKTLRLEIAPDVGRIPGDADELTQVLHNLIENAVKYGAPDTEVTVTLGKRDNAPGIVGRAVAIAVRDRGEGIPPEHLPRLTERFFRVDAGRSRDKGGTGLGLAIVKHIVRRHRGRLQIESTPGEGSTFTVLLPAEIRR